MNKVVKGPEIISEWPVKDFGLEKEKISDIEEFLVGQGKATVDSMILKQIIQKSAYADTSAWTDKDFRYSILIQNSDAINEDSAIGVFKKKGSNTSIIIPI